MNESAFDTEIEEETPQPIKPQVRGVVPVHATTTNFAAEIESRVEIIKYLQEFINTVLFEEQNRITVYISDKLKNFAKSEIESLFGLKQQDTNSGLTREEILALKILAAKIMGSSPSPMSEIKPPEPNIVQFASSMAQSLPPKPEMSPKPPDAPKKPKAKKPTVKEPETLPPPTPSVETKPPRILVKTKSGLQMVKEKKSKNPPVEPVKVKTPKAKFKKTVETRKALVHNIETNEVYEKEVEVTKSGQVYPTDTSQMKPAPSKQEWETNLNASAHAQTQYNQRIAALNVSAVPGLRSGVAESSVAGLVQRGMTRNVVEE